jgi:predicted N-acetyltransferase YhbS
MDDMPSIIGLIDDAAQWLQTEKNSDQWKQPWPDEPSRDQRIRRGIKVARTWMVENDDGLVGTVSFGRGGNKKLWTQRERNQPAIYVSRLIVSRRHASDGIGADLIDWAGRRGALGWGAEWIRVDVWTSNDALQAYYKRQGFAPVRTWQFNDPWEYPSAALLQKPTTDINVAAAARFQEPTADINVTAVARSQEPYGLKATAETARNPFSSRAGQLNRASSRLRLFATRRSGLYLGDPEDVSDHEPLGAK